MKIIVKKNKSEVGIAAAELGAKLIKKAIRDKGRANVVFATGGSQMEMVTALVKAPGIDWARVTAFHLDEYIGISRTHPASFRKFLWDRIASQLPLPLAACHYISPDDNPEKECRRVSELIGRHPIDVCFAGIGENGHLAFNDPPADFKTNSPYLIVNLDETCRRQQIGEGWFKTLKQVPQRAISMSVRQVMKSKAIICPIPDKRKAQAVKDCSEGKVTPMHPASILQRHRAAYCFLDTASASLLRKS